MKEKNIKIVFITVIILLICMGSINIDIDNITGNAFWRSSSSSFLSRLRFWKYRTPIIYTCKDNGGDDSFKQGTVNYRNKNYVDFCSTSGRRERDENRFKVSSCSGDRCYVNEYICYNNRVTSKKVKCDNGCSNGACLKKIKESCVDTDEGKDHFKQGTITVTYTNGYKRTETDSCNKDGTLREWYCGNIGEPAGLLRSENYVKCPEGYECKNGACEGKIEDKICYINKDCDDNDINTRDVCMNPGKDYSECQYYDIPDYVQCTDVLKNGNPDNQIDIVFLGDGFNNLQEFNNNVLKQIDKDGKYQGREEEAGLLSLEPFKSRANKFNFYKIDYDGGFDCNYGSRPLFCNTNKILEIASACPFDYIILITNTNNVQGGGGTRIITTSLKPETTLHEFGHSLGNLADEYVGWVKYDGEPGQPIEQYNTLKEIAKDSPNIDIAGCPSWCESNINNYETECTQITGETECRRHNRILTDSGYIYDPFNPQPEKTCVWFSEPHPYFKTNCVNAMDYKDIGIDCIGDTGCYLGAYFGQLLWRPHESRYDNTIKGSIMHTLGSLNGYGILSEQHMANVIDCCYPEDFGNRPSKCIEFSNNNRLFAGCK